MGCRILCLISGRHHSGTGRTWEADTQGAGRPTAAPVTQGVKTITMMSCRQAVTDMAMGLATATLRQLSLRRTAALTMEACLSRHLPVSLYLVLSGPAPPTTLPCLQSAT